MATASNSPGLPIRPTESRSGFLEGRQFRRYVRCPVSAPSEAGETVPPRGLWKKDFGYQTPPGIHRGAGLIQVERRAILAKSRNHLLMHALDDEEWVLWLDVDVIEYPPDVLQHLLRVGKSIVQPHCTFWITAVPASIPMPGATTAGLHLDDLRQEGELVELDTVGATMLLVRADLHRDGLVFPAFPYGRASSLVRSDRGELETEGFGIMAVDMGHRCWGMPHLEIRHGRW